MKDRNYIPGFDWVKLFGCILIVLAHTYLVGLIERFLSPQAYAFLKEVVPVFFMISGYLMYISLVSKQEPLRYMKGYILKYGIPFLLLCLIGNLRIYLGIYNETGIFHTKSFIVDMCLIPFYSPSMYQLWFIPPLILGILVNAVIYLKRLEKVSLFFIAPFVFGVMACSIYGEHFMFIPLVQQIVSWEYFHLIGYFLFQSAKGIGYVYIGMWIAKHQAVCSKLQLRYSILPALVITCIEFCLINRFGSAHRDYLDLNISVIIWSVIFFLGILRLKGHFLQKYHTHISIFSGVMFFLHVAQMSILKHWFDNGIVIFFIILMFNIVLTLFIIKWIRPRKKR